LPKCGFSAIESKNPTSRWQRWRRWLPSRKIIVTVIILLVLTAIHDFGYFSGRETSVCAQCGSFRRRHCFGWFFLSIPRNAWTVQPTGLTGYLDPQHTCTHQWKMHGRYKSYRGGGIFLPGIHRDGMTHAELIKFTDSPDFAAFMSDFLAREPNGLKTIRRDLQNKQIMHLAMEYRSWLDPSFQAHIEVGHWNK